jgi:hypothetical protein
VSSQDLAIGLCSEPAGSSSTSDIPFLVAVLIVRILNHVNFGGVMFIELGTGGH